MVAESPYIIGHSYTHARRYPWVLGKVGGAALPTQLTPSQVAVLVGSFLVLLWTRAIWAHLGAMVNLLVQVGLPCALAWALRHLRIEGRSPAQTLAGLVSYALFPKGGQLHGRPHRPGGPRRLGGTRVYLVAAPARIPPGPSGRGRRR